MPRTSADTKALRLVCFATWVAASGANLLAQTPCTTGWAPANLPGTNGTVRACRWWDPDGLGPRGEVLVVGGSFSAAGDRLAACIAAYDPQSGAWSTFGSGMDAEVTSLAALANGELVAGGAFTTAGGQPCQHVARWDGQSWQPLGAGVGSVVHAIAVRPNGHVVVGGRFTSAGGGPASHIAEWDGGAWSSLNGGVTTNAINGLPPVSALLVMPNGDVVVGGNFTQAGGLPANCVARWDGVGWTPLGLGIPANPGFAAWNPVEALALLPNGDLVAGGLFGQAGGTPASSVARWNGSTWSAMGGGVSGPVCALAARPNGRVVAAGQLTLQAVREWNGTGWQQVGAALSVHSLATHATGAVAMAGLFTTPGSNVAFWSGAAWSAPSVGAPSPGHSLDGAVLAVAAQGNELLVGGSFQNAGGLATGPVARWNGSSWSLLGSPFAVAWPAPFPQVQALATLRDGSVVVGGYFDQPAANLARWNGSGWSGIGSGMNGSVLAVLETDSGELVAGGAFAIPAQNIARWNGSAWNGLGSGLGGVVWALAELPNGLIVAGGDFTTAGGSPAQRIALWDGANWQPFGSGLDGGVRALCVLPDGSVVAGGAFQNAGGVPAQRVARWDGLSWSAMGAGLATPEVNSLRTLPNGDVLAGGGAGVVARWNGSAWSLVDGGTNGPVYALASLPDGDILAAGLFSTAGATGSVQIGRITTSCPAVRSAYGAGCAGAGGVDTLVADTLPWAGSTLRTTATGLPTQSLAFRLLGLQAANVALASLVPQGVAGCDVLVAPMASTGLVVAQGAAHDSFGIPNAPFVVGVQLLAQVVTLETGVAGGLLAVTSSNGLQLRIGAF
jgi:hypothetical protein